MGVETDTEPSIRDTLVAVQAESGEAVEAPVVVESSPEPQESTEPAELTEAQPNDGRVRDEKGRFIQKAGGQTPAQAAGQSKEAPGSPPPPVAAAAATPPAPSPTPAEPELRAPQAWKPLAREKFAALPREVQEEVIRREQAVAVGMQEAAADREVARGFRDVLSPFESHIRARGGDPLKTVQSFLQTGYTLDSGSPRDRARIAAQIIAGYDIDPQLVAAELDAGPASAPRSAPQGELRDPRLDKLLGDLEQTKRRQAEQYDQENRAAIEAFAQKVEYFEDLAPTMAQLIRANPGMKLEEAHEWALASPKHRDIREILEQRKAAAASKQATPQRPAAISLKGQPTSPVNGTAAGSSIQEDLLAVRSQLSGR
jgi:hypothetical protein